MPASMINATWHKKHRMPPRPTATQRLRWHLAHAEACGCRVLTPAMLAKLHEAVAKERSRHLT